ncbi:hypothetical protein TSUD_239990 [Trifolium subterraneum]|uniref:TF-B3 domain-containing protein n=1 Tax=Trifolium subterraneum TaxID=3900 RepID=A0A2Z6NSE3_TRISU|nr:hypothetical protein TSUD_239990 [Trifolium subterraneum]
MLPQMFSSDFGDEIYRFVTLIDSRQNQFKIMVEKVNNNVYFTRGWASIRDFYNIRIGAWLSLMYTGLGQFGLSLHTRFQQLITPPVCDPPMRFVLDKSCVPKNFVGGLPSSIERLSYSHQDSFFHFVHEKALTYYDVSTGLLTLPYDGFGEFVFEEAATSIRLVDECGNLWTCDLTLLTFPCKHFKIGGDWSRMVSTRRLSIGVSVKIGAPAGDHNESIYFMLTL